MSDLFHVGQALFGYREGHHLVASSFALAPRQRQFLANATDGSGPESSVGFEAPYTGLPVPETDYYALFCTWPAPEMPRPGCVWSHVLLLDRTDLARIPDLSILRSLFLRPAVPPDLSAYEKPLNLIASNAASGLGSPEDKHRAAYLLPALYGQAENGVVVLDEQSLPWEITVFGLWSQQWPRLRRTFAFSTGSLGDRRLAGVAFDLQVAPLSSQRLWGRGGPPTLVLDYSSQSPPLPPPPWVRTALEDLLRPDVNGFRTFLRTYGTDVGALRAAFTPLAHLHRSFAIADTEPWMVTLRAIAAEFPAPDEAGTLKLASVSKPPSFSAEATLDRLVDSISFLCVEDTAGAFARVDFDFATALADLWPARREAVGAILTKLPLTEVRWTALAKAVAGRMSGDEVPWLWETHPELLVPFVRLNPVLATAPSVWRLPDRSQWGVVEALEASEVSQVLWRDITRAMLAAETMVAAREVTQRAGVAALDGALDWLVETPSAKFPPPLWREVLRPLAEERLAHDALSPPVLAFCAAIVPATIAAGLPATRPDLRTLASEPLDTLPASLRLPTAFLLVTIGLQASAQDGAPLLARGFFPVYEALEGAVEPPEAWRLLQAHLPMLWFWEEWDRCLKLRRALENWVRAHPGTLSTILAAARKPADRKWLESLG